MLMSAQFIWRDLEHSSARSVYCVRTGYGVMESSQFCLKPDERVNVKWIIESQLNLHFVYNFTELHFIISREQIDKHSICELPQKYCKSNDLYWLTFKEELHLTIRPIIFKTSTLNLNDVKLIVLHYTTTTVQQFSKGTNLVLS